MNKEHNHMTTHPLARRSRIIAASTAVALAAAGAVAVPLVASATGSDSPYVTVAWAYPGYPDMTVPQPYIASTPGANLHAFDELAESGAWCGKPIQVDVYQRTDKHGVSWETLKETGALLNSHDGGFLAYNAGLGTPYRVITSEEYPCTTTTPAPTPTPQPSGSPSGVPTPSDSPTPTAPPTPSSPPVPTPTGTPTSTPTPSAPVTAPTPTGGTPEPSAPGTATPPTIPVQPTPSTSPRSSQPSAAPAPAVTAPDLPAAPLPVAVSGSVSFTG